MDASGATGTTAHGGTLTPPARSSRTLLALLLSLAAAAGPSGCNQPTAKPKPATNGSTGSALKTAPRPRTTPIEKLTPTKDYSSAVVRSGLREQAIEALMAGGRSKDASVRANATEACLQAPSRLETLVASSLKDDNLGVRSVSAVVVGKAMLKSLSPALRPLLSDSSAFVRAAAIYGLRRCGEDVDATPLSNYLLNDPSPKVRSHAAFLLGELGDRSAAPMIRAAAKKSMPRASEADIRLMQLQFAEALVKLGDESQIQSVRAALYPSRVEELEATALAVQIIGTLRDRGATDQLIYLSAKEDQTGNQMPAEIRLGIASSLAQLGNRRGNFIAEEFWNDPSPVIRSQAASVFGATGQADGLVYLERLMIDPSEQVRVSAAAAMLKALGTADSK